MSVNAKRTVRKPVLVSSTKTITQTPHSNFMGGPSYDINNPLLQLAVVTASSFFGEPMYYKGQKTIKTEKEAPVYGSRRIKSSGGVRAYLSKLLRVISSFDDESPKDAMISVIRQALDYDPQETLRWAAILRNEEFIRTTPQIIMVEAANHPKVKGTGLVRAFASKIIKRADEPAVQLAYQLQAFGKPIPNSLKRSWADFLKNADDYSLAKYRMEDRVVKTVDVGNLAYKRGFYGYDTAIGKLMRGELKLGDQARTWESIRSAGGTWEEAIPVMGHMALLRNLRNFSKDKVAKGLYIDKLIAGAEKGMQLPFRYLSAHIELKKAGCEGYLLDAVEECMERSLGGLPKLPGRSLILADNSGSTRGTPISSLSTMNVAKIGNLMSVITGKVSEEGVAGVFGDGLEYFDIRKKASVMDQTMMLDNAGKGIGGGTENGVWLALDDAIRNRKHWDNIFIYSDQQAGHGGLYGKNRDNYRAYNWMNSHYIDVPKLLSVYREKVNSKVNVFLVQIAGYKDTLLPENYYRTFILGGWSGNILKFAKRMIDTFDSFEKQ